MTTMTKEQIEKAAHEALNELEQLADDIKVRMKLASMDARDVWEKKLEPRLFEARQHARDAKDSSRNAIEALEDTLRVFRDFVAAL